MPVWVAIAVSPPAVYRMDLGQGPVDEYGRQMLAPADLAFAISYALTDQKPDADLLEAAKSGRLSTRADVAREVAVRLVFAVVYPYRRCGARRQGALGNEVVDGGLQQLGDARFHGV